jgi:orotate phosphoribosyltransferase
LDVAVDNRIAYKVLRNEARWAMTRVTLEDVHLLRDLMQETCIRHGDFTLSSGRHSHYYYNGKRATLRPRTAQIIGEIILDMIEGAGAEAIGGLEIGSIPISESVALASTEAGAEIPAFIVRKEQKQHGIRDRVAEAAPEDTGEHLLSPGRPVAIVDDVITTGGSLDKAIEVVEELGCKVVIVIALVERHEGGGDTLRRRGYNFQRLFYTDEAGSLFVDEGLQQRVAGVAPERVLRG